MSARRQRHARVTEHRCRRADILPWCPAFSPQYQRFLDSLETVGTPTTNKSSHAHSTMSARRHRSLRPSRTVAGVGAPTCLPGFRLSARRQSKTHGRPPGPTLLEPREGRHHIAWGTPGDGNRASRTSVLLRPVGAPTLLKRQNPGISTGASRPMSARRQAGTQGPYMVYLPRSSGSRSSRSFLTRSSSRRRSVFSSWLAFSRTVSVT